MDVHVFRATAPPTAADVRELKNFLESSSADSEKSLQRFFEQHPSLIGVLEFSEFLSEVPLIKPDADNEPDGSDLRKRDRADLIGAKTSPLSDYRCANIIELKGARRPIGDRGVGFRLSVDTNTAIDQLYEYRSWITTIPQNKAMLKKLNWDVRWPTLNLIMGGRQEFAGNPGQLEEIKSRLLERGIALYTIDDLADRAQRQVDQRIIAPYTAAWFAAPANLAKASRFIATVVNNYQRALEITVADPSTLDSMHHRVFVEVVAEIFRRMGYSIQVNYSQQDLRVDILATTTTAEGERDFIAIQCKHSGRNRKQLRTISLEEIRGFMRYFSRDGGPMRGAIVTSGNFSQSVSEFGFRRNLRVSLVDRAALLDMIRRVLPAGR